MLFVILKKGWISVNNPYLQLFNWKLILRPFLSFLMCTYLYRNTTYSALQTRSYISHTHTLVVAVHLRFAARLDTWLDSSLLCLSTPHMLWTRGENTLQGSGVQNPNRTLSCSAPAALSHCCILSSNTEACKYSSFQKSWSKTFYKRERTVKNIFQWHFQNIQL